MYDVNPLGPLMHLKELERQAASTLRVPTHARTSAVLHRWLAMLVAQGRRMLAHARPLGRRRA
jgi:hypothetical protein